MRSVKGTPVSSYRPRPSGLDADGLIARHPMHPAFAELMLLRERDADAIPRLAQILDRSPELLGRMIETGKSSPIWSEQVGRTLDEGIDLLGYRAVHASAVLTAVLDAMDAPTATVDVIAFWRQHTLAAMFGLLLGGARRDGTIDLAGTGALVRDVGRLAIDQEHGELWAAVDGEVAAGRSRFDAEIAVLSVRPDDVTIAMLQQWGAPPPLFEAVRETLDRRETSTLATVIGDATRAATSYSAGGGVSGLLARAAEVTFGSLEAVSTRVDALLASSLFD